MYGTSAVNWRIISQLVEGCPQFKISLSLIARAAPHPRIILVLPVFLLSRTACETVAKCVGWKPARWAPSRDHLVTCYLDSTCEIDWRTWERNSYHLETTYYVTDLKQMTDFAWYRDSGVRLNVAARDVNLVPAYDDVIDTGSDNAFVLTNPGASSADVTRFKDVIRRHCRSVISLARRQKK